jgi:DHA1 family bicyclomycin/chloramphenicol resistance-like MFS transporter
MIDIHMTQNTLTPKRMTRRRTALLGAFLTAIGPISMGIYTPAMPTLADAFLTTDSAIKVSLALYFAGFSLAQLVAGPSADALGRRKSALIFLSIFLVGSLIAVFAPTIEVLLAARLLQGIGASIGVTVARAIVRDQFTGHDSAAILNLTGTLMAIGPAIAPTLGGLLLAGFGWQSIFAALAVMAITALGTITLLLVETTIPDPDKLMPATIVRNYATLLRDRSFVMTCLIMAGTTGALFAQASMLTFILIHDVGLTPTQFGLTMLMQSGAYFIGTICCRYAMQRISGQTCATIGVICSGVGGLLIAASAILLSPSILAIMIPVAISTFGIAFVTPYILTASMLSFPHIAGSASSFIVFIQMAVGFLAGILAALIGKPLLAFGIIIPAMSLAAVLAYIVFFLEKRRA